MGDVNNATNYTITNRTAIIVSIVKPTIVSVARRCTRVQLTHRQVNRGNKWIRGFAEYTGSISGSISVNEQGYIQVYINIHASKYTSAYTGTCISGHTENMRVDV